MSDPPRVGLDERVADFECVAKHLIEWHVASG